MGVAEAFPVGEYIEEELEARGWSQADFADILKRPAQFVSEIISGKKELTRESAAQVGAAFGTSPELWLNLQDRYLLWQQSMDEGLQKGLDDVQRRARLNDWAPITELRRRGAIQGSSLEEVEAEIIELFEVSSLEEKPVFGAAARRSNHNEHVTKLQIAWLALAKRKARQQDLPSYDSEKFEHLASTLSQVLSTSEAFSHLPEKLRAAGVGLVHEPNFPRGKIDGAAFMLGDNPVIALSGRGKRLDKVLFTLLHEIAHVLNCDVSIGEPQIDTGLSESSAGEADAMERAADERAARLVFPQGPLAEPPAQVRQKWVAEEAVRQQVHPIVVIGRLQKDGKVDWRSALVKGAPTVERQLATW